VQLGTCAYQANELALVTTTQRPEDHSISRLAGQEHLHCLGLPSGPGLALFCHRKHATGLTGPGTLDKIRAHDSETRGSVRRAERFRAVRPVGLTALAGRFMVRPC